MYQGRTVFRRQGRRHIWRWIALFVALILIGSGIYTVIDNGRVVVRTQRVLVASLPKALEGFTVLHVSDLNAKQFGPSQKQLQTVLKNRKYNAVCITGNMVGLSGDHRPFIEALLAMDPTRPVYFIAGESDPMVNIESDGILTTAEWVLNTQQTRNATFVTSPASMQVGTGTVWFSDASQLALDMETAMEAYDTTTTALGAYQADILRATRTAREQMQDEDLHIVLSSRPLGTDIVERLQGMSEETSRFTRTIDLVLAGGTVGGQWRIPLVGPVWYEGWFPPENQTYGYHYAGSVSLLQYISGGLGTNPRSPLPDFRLFNPPEVTLVTFTSQMQDGTLPNE